MYDDTLAGIERSNQELEQRLGGRVVASHTGTRGQTAPAGRNGAGHVDTIHNSRQLEQEIIYEESLSDLSRSSSVSTLKPDSGPEHSSLQLHTTPDHPSLADLGSIADLSAKFQVTFYTQ